MRQEYIRIWLAALADAWAFENPFGVSEGDPKLGTMSNILEQRSTKGTSTISNKATRDTEICNNNQHRPKSKKKRGRSVSRRNELGKDQVCPRKRRKLSQLS